MCEACPHALSSPALLHASALCAAAPLMLEPHLPLPLLRCRLCMQGPVASYTMNATSDTLDRLSVSGVRLGSAWWSPSPSTRPVYLPSLLAAHTFALQPRMLPGS